MNYQEHLLTILSEECSEVAQRATKCLRFGIKEIQPTQDLTNAERLQYEFGDLLAVYDLLVKNKMVKKPTKKQILWKQTKVKEFLKYSAKVGTLSGNV